MTHQLTWREDKCELDDEINTYMYNISICVHIILYIYMHTYYIILYIYIHCVSGTLTMMVQLNFDPSPRIVVSWFGEFLLGKMPISRGQ